MTDEVHQGEIGRDFYEELRIDEEPDGLEDEEMADLEEVGHEENDADDVDDVDGLDVDGGVAAGAAGAAGAAPFFLEEIDVDTRTMVLGALVLLTVMAVYLRRRGDGSDEETQPAEEPAGAGDGGLV